MDKSASTSVGKSPPRPMGLFKRILFILTLPCVILMVGDLLAWPIAKYRHSNLFMWLLWMFLRLSVPIAIIMLCIYFLIRYLFFR
jgi:hypothetical protein